MCKLIACKKSTSLISKWGCLVFLKSYYSLIVNVAKFGGIETRTTFSLINKDLAN
jgi:hypothetical protein